MVTFHVTSRLELETKIDRGNQSINQSINICCLTLRETMESSKVDFLRWEKPAQYPRFYSISKHSNTLNVVRYGSILYVFLNNIIIKNQRLFPCQKVGPLFPIVCTLHSNQPLSSPPSPTKIGLCLRPVLLQPASLLVAWTAPLLLLPQPWASSSPHLSRALSLIGSLCSVHSPSLHATPGSTVTCAIVIESAYSITPCHLLPRAVVCSLSFFQLQKILWSMNY